jgi:hypothetical protein
MEQIDLATGPVSLQPNWFTRIEVDGVSDERPGIYEWRIEGVGVYIGKYGRIRRPTKEYGRNLKRMLNGQNYRLNDKNGFRKIHHALLDAHRNAVKITLTILENVIDPHQRSARERVLIAQRRAEAKSGGLPVLNSD